jgi:hypothetical protein
MGAEAGRKALLALQSVAAEEGAPISGGGKMNDDMHQLRSRALDMLSSMVEKFHPLYSNHTFFFINIARLMVAPRRKASAQQLASKFTILAPPLSSTLSVASAPVSPHKERGIEALTTGNLPAAPFESISLPATPTATENRSSCLPENGFFLAIMSVYWSNLVGPRIEQVPSLVKRKQYFAGLM